MSSENPSRRAIVAGASSVPALALPAVAVASTEPDPIFAAIERYRTAIAAHAQTFDATSDAQDVFKEKYGALYPDALPKKAREELAVIAGCEKSADRTVLTHRQITKECRPGGILPPDLAPRLHRELNRQEASWEHGRGDGR